MGTRRSPLQMIRPAAGVGTATMDPGVAEPPIATSPPIRPVAPAPPAATQQITVLVRDIPLASVTIDSLPPHQASAPVTASGLDPMTAHTVLVRADGRVDYRTTLPNLLFGPVTLTITPDMMPLRSSQLGTALVTVMVPAGASVYADGDATPFVGSPPSRVLLEGEHILVAKAPGKADSTQRIIVRSGVAQTVSFGALAPAASEHGFFARHWGTMLGVGALAVAVGLGLTIGARSAPQQAPEAPPSPRLPTGKSRGR